MLLLIETALSYFVTLHYVDKTYDRWLLNSAHSLEQEIKITNKRIAVKLSANALEVFSWDDLDKTYFKIVAEKQGELAGNHALPELEFAEFNGEEPVYFNTQINNNQIRVVSVRVQNQQLPEKSLFMLPRP